MSKNNNMKMGVFIVSLGALFYFYEYFLRIFPSVMKAQLIHDFHLNATLFGALSAYYFYAYTPMQLVVGVLVDRFSLRKVLTLSVFCCVIGTYLIGISNAYYLATFGRFLQGFGSAFAFVGSLKLAAMWLPAERFAFFSGACAALGFIGGAFGEISITLLLKHMSWRHALIGFGLIGNVLAIVFWFYLRKSPKQHCPKKNKLTIGQFLKQFKLVIGQHRIWIAGVLSSLMFLPTSVFAALWGIPYLEKFHHYSTDQAAIATSMIFVGWAIGAPIQGLISDRCNTRLKVIMVGALGGAVLSFIMLYDAKIAYPTLCLCFIFFGIFSSSQVLTFAMARDISSPQIAGTAIAFVNALAMIGGMVFQRGVGKLLDLSWSGHVNQLGDPVYQISDYQHALMIIPICLCIAGTIAMICKTPHELFIHDRASSS